MSDDPAVEVIDDDAVDVAATTAAYEAAPDHFVEKFGRRALADRFGDAFLERVPDAAGRARVLDVGCGPGSDVVAFAERGLAVVGVDLSESLLRAGVEAAPTAGFVRGDMRRLPVADAAFDGLWSSASLLHLARSEAPAAIAEFARVLDDDGALFVSVMAREPRDVDAVETEDGRRFAFWRKPALRERLADAGFEVTWDSGQTEWHAVVAVRD